MVESFIPYILRLYQGTKAEGAIQKLFVGKMKSYIKCVNVDFESSRIEEFNGKGHRLPSDDAAVLSYLKKTSSSTSRA